MSSATQRPVLVVDDSEEDLENIQRCFKNAGVTHPVHTCCDGEEMLEYLYGMEHSGQTSSPVLPCLILLDLNLPGDSGIELLQKLKKSASLNKIPVIILSSSSQPLDVHNGYRHGANSYIQKSSNLTEFTETVRKLKEFWLETAIGPHRELFADAQK